MLAEFLRELKAIASTTAVLQTEVNPLTGASILGVLNGSGAFNKIAEGRAKAQWKPITVRSVRSLVDYAQTHAAAAMTEKDALLQVNIEGLRLRIDYVNDGAPDYSDHRVSFPAAFDEECETPARVITSALGKWVPLDQFETILDTCAAFILNFADLEEATATMEGHETAKISKTRTGFAVEVKGEVTSTAAIPKDMKVGLLFMGRPISVDIPIRLQVQNKTVHFMLVDNGAIPKAKMDILRSIKAEVVAALPDLLVIDGKVGE